MSLLTSPGPIIRDSIGSLTMLSIPLTTLTSSDTFSIGTNPGYINSFISGNSVVAGTSYGGDTTYSSTTGLVTIVSANQGSIDLIVWIRG